MHTAGTVVPQAREKGLIVSQLNDETLVYDSESDKAHCLNQTAALVWQQCDGQTTIADLTRRLQTQLQSPVNEKVVWYALDQLDQYRLLQEHVTLPAEFAQLSRREFIQKLKVAAVVALPVILSITAPTRAQAASCLPDGDPCSPNGVNAQCCSNFCNNGVCGAPT